MNLAHVLVKHRVKVQCALLLTPFIALLSQNSLAANAAHGKDLHDANCQSCHASLMGGNPDQIYTRSNRRVTSINGLRNQVTRCKTTVGVSWPDDKIDDVVEYLNSQFYKL